MGLTWGNSEFETVRAWSFRLTRFLISSNAENLLGKLSCWTLDAECL